MSDTKNKAHAEPVAWKPIETAPKGRIVLVYYTNRLGQGRTMRARYYLPETLDSDTTESGWADEGWYEESEAYEYLMPIDGDPTHWMDLPSPPGSAPQPDHFPHASKMVPLTDEEIDAITRASRDALMDHVYEHGTTAEGQQSFIRNIARAIEAAHGIGSLCDSKIANTAATDDMKLAVRWAPISAFWSERLRDFFGPDAREGIDALERQISELISQRDELLEALQEILQDAEANHIGGWDTAERLEKARAAIAKVEGRS